MADHGVPVPPPFRALEDAWLAIRDLLDRLGPLIKAEIDDGVNGAGREIGVDETKIAHGLRLVPRMALHSCDEGVFVEHLRSDEAYTYWRASAPTTIKIVLIP